MASLYLYLVILFFQCGEIKRHCSNRNRQTFAKQPLPDKLTNMLVGQAYVCLVFFPAVKLTYVFSNHIVSDSLIREVPKLSHQSNIPMEHRAMRFNYPGRKDARDD